MQEIKGVYYKAIYIGDKGYIIGLLRLKETDSDSLKNKINKTITFTGYFHDLNEGDLCLFYGREIIHDRYGHQFNVSKYELVMPESIDGIVEFLSSNLFSGVGSKLARSIVDTLGENALDIIISNPEKLQDVPRLSKNKADNIREKLLEYEQSHKIIVQLCDFGFILKDALRIYKLYGSDTLNKLEHNVYKVMFDIPEIGFNKIDILARKLNVNFNDEHRVKAGIVHLMQDLCYKDGDTYLKYDDIKSELVKFLRINIDDETLKEYFRDLELNLHIVIEGDKYYLYDLYYAEENIVNTLKYLNSKPLNKYDNLEEIIQRVESNFSIEYNDLQKDAISEAIINNVSIITGGPGTGKTTIIKAIIEVYKRINKLEMEELGTELALLAPTGRASKKLQQLTGYEAMTIHRFLKWNKDLDQFAVNEYAKDNSKLIIIDELSMVDLLLFDNLFKGLRRNIKLVLIGDYHQLPSVSPGQVLRDLVCCEKIALTKLNDLYRQSEDSYIPLLAQEIKKGQMSEAVFNSYSDYRFINCSSSSIITNLKLIVSELLMQGYDYLDFQIMAPIYRGRNGIDNLNWELQKIINPSSVNKAEYISGGVTYRVGDKVIQLVNFPEENIYNGDLGKIVDIVHSTYSGSGKTEIYIKFDEVVVKYLPQSFNQFCHAYVISIHKSQGSEFPVVIMTMCNYYQRMLYRKLIYTGITRARQKLVIIGEPNAFESAIMNINEYERKSDLLNKFMDNL